MGGNSAPKDTLGEAAASYERVADELETAARHVRVAARHLSGREVPRGCAHAFAAQRRLHTAQGELDGLAVLQASRLRAE